MLRFMQLPMLPIRKSPLGFPMAPTQEEWDALTLEERQAVVEALPGEVTYAEMAPPEGDFHLLARHGTFEALREFYRSQRRKVFIREDFPVYYPSAPRFGPDVLVVFDAEDYPRMNWVVSKEGRGLDWVFEAHHAGDRKKDAERNVARYAALGIPEYFFFDCERNQLHAYRLPTAEARVYVPILPQHGVYASAVLGLEARVLDNRVRFFSGTAVLPDADELRERLERMTDDALERVRTETERLDAQTARAQGESARAQAEAARADAAEAEVARLRAELEALKKE